MENFSNKQKGIFCIILAIGIYFLLLAMSPVPFLGSFGIYLIIFLFIYGFVKIFSNKTKKIFNLTVIENPENISRNQRIINSILFIVFLFGIPIFIGLIISKVEILNPDYFAGPLLVLFDEKPSGFILFVNFLLYMILPISWILLLVWWFKNKLR